jgi:hypothetical protein
LPYSRSSGFSFMWSSRSFTVLYFTFRSVIHFESLFVKDVKSVFYFFVLVLWYLVISASFLENSIIVIVLHLLLSQRSIDYIYVQFLSSLFASIDWFVYSFMFLHRGSCYLQTTIVFSFVLVNGAMIQVWWH